MTTGSGLSNQANPAKIQTVIAARPGAIREALQATLALSSRLEISGVAGGSLSTLVLVRKIKPELLIIDSGLLVDEIAVLLQQIKQEQPQIRCLVVTDTTRQQEALLALGADLALLHSDPTEQLAKTLTSLEMW